MLEEPFTAAERTLLALGEAQRLREARLVIQEALEMPVRSAVERALGRRTVAFVTGVDVRHGIAINLCTVEPSWSAGELKDGDPSDAARIDQRLG